ncbi:YcxB family protein [Pengzhenrongella sp.]|jgi:hypothetical protein|uniref:YcxB family protein n=1 Tax=Pengzhenrongella sp. TaxID=2888820 RepID=UPI002F9388B8
MGLWEQKSLDLSWEPEIEDYAEAFRARNRARGLPAKIAVMVVVALVVALAGFLTERDYLVVWGLGGVACLAYIVLVTQRQMVNAFWKGSVELHAPTQVRVVPGDGVTSTIPGITVRFAWSKFDGFLETDRVFVVQMATHRKGAFVIIAKRGLASAGDVSRLRDILVAETGWQAESRYAIPRRSPERLDAR